MLDEVVGLGFHVLADGERVTASELGRPLASIRARIARVVPVGTTLAPGDVEDIDGVLLRHLRSCGHAIQIVRPDFYIFGGTSDPAGLASLTAELERALSIRVRSVRPPSALGS